MTDDIVYEATYPHPPAAVWRALTTPAAMGAWLMDTDFREATVGHRFQFRDKPKKVLGWNGITDCEVLEVVPERRFVFAFGANQDQFPLTRIFWELEPLDEGRATRVRFRHSGFTGVKGWLMRAGMNHGWAAIVRHAIPYVMTQLDQGRVPPREEVREVAKQRTREARHGARS